MITINLVSVYLDLRDIGIVTTFERRRVGTPYLHGCADGITFDVFDNDCAIYHGGGVIDQIDHIVQRHRHLTEATTP